MDDGLAICEPVGLEVAAWELVEENDPPGVTAWLNVASWDRLGVELDVAVEEENVYNVPDGIGIVLDEAAEGELGIWLGDKDCERDCDWLAVKA